MTVRKGYRIEPLPEAYSRVTNPERFRPLHDFALALASRLRAGFDVDTRETFEPIPGRMGPFEHARPPLTLTPATPDAAPIAIAFTTFPSLVVRCGRWFAEPFPICACDACAATAAGESARLEEIVGDVIAGHFAEELRIPLFLGSASIRWWFGGTSVGHARSGGSRVPREVARMLRGAGPDRVQWKPWRPRALPGHP